MAPREQILKALFAQDFPYYSVMEQRIALGDAQEIKPRSSELRSLAY
jgi:hypothetical protein